MRDLGQRFDKVFLAIGRVVLQTGVIQCLFIDPALTNVVQGSSSVATSTSHLAELPIDTADEHELEQELDHNRIHRCRIASGWNHNKTELLFVPTGRRQSSCHARLDRFTFPLRKLRCMQDSKRHLQAGSIPNGDLKWPLHCMMMMPWQVPGVTCDSM